MATTKSLSPFKVTTWEPSAYDEGTPGPSMARVKVVKLFSGGELEGESKGEGLMCVGDPKNLSAGAGYVISERFVGTLAGKSGSFVLQHFGHSGPGFQKTVGHVVTGSGAGELAGITGSIEFVPDQVHVLGLEYELPGA